MHSIGDDWGYHKYLHCELQLKQAKDELLSLSLSAVVLCWELAFSVRQDPPVVQTSNLMATWKTIHMKT